MCHASIRDIALRLKPLLNQFESKFGNDSRYLRDFKDYYRNNLLAEWWSNAEVLPDEPNNLDDALYHMKVPCGYFKNKKEITPS